MSANHEIDLLTEQFKVLGDKTRLRILSMLRERELCVCDLTEVLQISQPGVSQHMRRLKQAGFVKERKGGQWVYYSLEKEHALNAFFTAIPSVKEDEEHLKKVKGCGEVEKK